MKTKYRFWTTGWRPKRRDWKLYKNLKVWSRYRRRSWIVRWEGPQLGLLATPPPPGSNSSCCSFSGFSSNPQVLISLYKIEKCPCVLQNCKMLFYFIFDEQKKVFSWLLWFLRDLNVILKKKMLGVPSQSIGWHLLLSLLWPGLTPW